MESFWRRFVVVCGACACGHRTRMVTMSGMLKMTARVLVFIAVGLACVPWITARVETAQADSTTDQLPAGSNSDTMIGMATKGGALTSLKIAAADLILAFERPYFIQFGAERPAAVNRLGGSRTLQSQHTLLRL